MKNAWRYSASLVKAALAIMVAFSLSSQPAQAWAEPRDPFFLEQDTAAEAGDTILAAPTSSELLEPLPSPEASTSSESLSALEEEVTTDDDVVGALSALLLPEKSLASGITPTALNDVFSADIIVGGLPVSCTFKVTAESGLNRTVQVGDGTNAAISTASAGDIVMPTVVTNAGTGVTYTVTAYGNAAFRYCSRITSTGLASHATVSSVGASTFEGCTSLTSTDLENNTKVTRLGNYAFSGCSILVSTGLATNAVVTSLGAYVFQNCTALTFTGFEGNQTITAISDYMFAGCTGLTSTGLATNAKLVTLNANAFKGCSLLATTGLESNGTVTTLGSSVFSGCAGLASTGLAANNKVTTVGGTAFQGCTSLTSTGLESNEVLTSVSNGMFSGCTSLTSTGLASNAVITTIGASAFASCSGLVGDLVIVSRITTIGVEAFWSTKYSRIYLLQNSLPSIGSGAFAFTGTQPVLYVPSAWQGGNAVTAGSRSFSTASNTLIYMHPPSITEVSALRSASDAAQVTFTLGAKGDVVVAADGVSASGNFEAGSRSITLSGIGTAQTTATLEATAFYGPVKTWYNTSEPPSQASALVPAYTVHIDVEYYFSGVHDPSRTLLLELDPTVYVGVSDVALAQTPAGYTLAAVPTDPDLSPPVSAGSLDGRTINVYYVLLPYQIFAQDFRYSIRSNHLSADEARRLACVSAFDPEGNPIDTSLITVDSVQLDAINAALAAGEGQEGFYQLSFYAPDGTKTTIGVVLHDDEAGQGGSSVLPTGPSAIAQMGDLAVMPVAVILAAGAFIVLWVYRGRIKKRD